MDASTKKIEDTEDPKHESPGERRRVSRVRHDDRGNAYVEWHDAPADLVDRPRLEILEEPGALQLETEHRAYDPYANGSGAARKTGNTTRTDLRKLSEWIKMMREIEERKRGDADEEQQG